MRRLAVFLLVALLVALARADESQTPISKNLEIPASITGERRKKLEEAIAAYVEAATHFRKDGFKAAKADLDKAAKLLRARVTADPREPLPLYYLGILYQLRTEDRHAIENLGKVVVLAPRFHEAWTELGDAHSHLGEYDKAEQAYARALELSPGYLEALRGRALERMDAGRFQEARQDVKHGLEKDPKDLLLLMLDQKLLHAIEGPRFPVEFAKETEHYIVRTDVDQVFADWIASQLELIRKHYVRVFERVRIEQPKRKYTVVVFANADEYHKAGGPAMAGGHYDPEVRQLFLFKYPKAEDGQMVLFHEGFHQFLHPYLARAPQWFNEGLGDYFGATKFTKRDGADVAKAVPNWWRLPKAKEIVKDGSARPLKELMLMTQAELYDPATVGANYAQAWSIIYFLCEYDQRRYSGLLGKYFSALRAGKDQDEAFKAAFGDQDMKKLDQEWRNFVLSL